jgi:hypothetical protein
MTVIEIVILLKIKLDARKEIEIVIKFKLDARKEIDIVLGSGIGYFLFYDSDHTFVFHCYSQRSCSGKYQSCNELMHIFQVLFYFVLTN